MSKIIIVNDSLQNNYKYELTSPVGQEFDEDFVPELTPKQMLEMGVFGGAYFSDMPSELPAEWFINAKLSKTGRADDSLNYFQVRASQPLLVWQQKGWIDPRDPRGWFQWYCRYYLGRRLLEEDQRQIKRWRAIRRHVSQVTKNCQPKDLACRRKQRQALLHWSYDSTKL